MGTQHGAKVGRQPKPCRKSTRPHPKHAGAKITLPRRRMELLISLVKLELDKVVLRETRTGMRVSAGR